MHGLARVVALPPGLPAKDEQTLADAIWDSTNLTHDLVLRVADVVTGKGWLTLVHEHSEGSLIDFLQRCIEELKSPYPAKVAARIALDVIEGLEQSRDHCAAAGIPWRPGSVAPGSLLLGRDGRIRALDGQITSAALRVPALRAQPGATAFAAPEMLDDSKEPSERSDVFSIGVLMWESLTGKTLFGEKCNALDLGHSFKVPKITQSVPEGVKVPQGLVHAVHTALEAEPLKRQASLRELAVAIVMGVEEVATYEQVIEFTNSILEPRPDERPEAPPPEQLLPQHTPAPPFAAAAVPDVEESHPHTPPTPMAAAAVPDAEGSHPHTPPTPMVVPETQEAVAPVAVAPVSPAAEVPLLRTSPLSERPPPPAPVAEAPPAQAAPVAQEPIAESAEALQRPPREKLDTWPGQGSPPPAEAAIAGTPGSIGAHAASEAIAPALTPSPQPADSVAARVPSSPAPSPQPPSEPFRLVSDEPFVPLAALPVQPVGDTPSQARPSEAPAVTPSRPAPAQAWGDSTQSESPLAVPKKRTLQLSVGTLILGFSTTVLAVIVIMLVMMRSQGPVSKEAPRPPQPAASETPAPRVGQPVEVANMGSPTVGNAVQSDAGVSMGTRPDPHKRAAKDQGKSPGKSTAPEAESGELKAGQPPSKHYIPNEL